MDTQQKQEGPQSPQIWLRCQDWQCTQTKEAWKCLLFTHKAFQGKQSKPLRLVWNWFETVRRGDWLEVSIVVKGWGWVRISEAYMVWIFHQFQRRDHPGFLLSLPRCEAEGEKGGWSLRAVSNQISKMGSDSLLHWGRSCAKELICQLTGFIPQLHEAAD